MDNSNEQDRSEQYSKPQIADYGDLVEQTAHGASGKHVDASLKFGDEATFLSTTP